MSQFEHAMLFKCIVEQQSLTKAAEKYGVNVPAVSKRLTKLEQSLGTQLINRTTRQLTLTEAGQYFYDKVKHLQYEWLSVLDETSSLGKDPKGTLRIAAPQPLLSRFLMPILAEFCQHYSSIRLELIPQKINTLPSREADISISREINNYDSHTTVMTAFYSYHNRLFSSPDYLHQHTPIKTVQDLRKHCCLVYENKYLPVNWEFESVTIGLDKIMPVDSAEVMISAAKNGFGIAYLPNEILEEELRKQQLIPVLPELRSKVYKTCVYYPKADFVPQKVRLLIDFLKNKQEAHE